MVQIEKGSQPAQLSLIRDGASSQAVSRTASTNRMFLVSFKVQFWGVLTA